MKTHISEPFTLCEIGEALNYHPAYLSRFFRNATGEKLFDFIANQRLMRAKMLLRTTSLRVSEIAAKCGYENAQYFATQFKSAEGVTPTQWRSQS